MTPIVFKWTDFALGHGIRLASILLIALILNRLLRTLTRRLVPAAGNEVLGRIARMREQHVKTLAGILYSGGTAVIILGAVLTALPDDARLDSVRMMVLAGDVLPESVAKRWAKAS